MNGFLVLTQATTPIIGPIAKFFGLIINGMYNLFFDVLGIQSIGITIIAFTIVIKLLMIPLAIKQQKSMKDTQKVQPELKKIQAKYKGKKDAESQKKLQAESAKLYQDHNVNPLGGCLPTLVQLPIMFALFAVLRNIPAYINQVKDVYIQIFSTISTNVPEYGTIIETVKTAKSAAIKGFDPTIQNKVVDLMATFDSKQWLTFKESFSSIGDLVAPLIDKLENMNYFLTINLADKPVSMSNGIQGFLTVGAFIPILCFLAQILVSKTANLGKNISGSGNATIDQTQKTMMYTMPLLTLMFVVNMPAGLGLYWLASNIFQIFQQIVINKHLEKGTK